MTILDTHAWIWWVGEPARLGKGARRTLEAARRIGVPAIACLEVAALAQRGRITLDRPVLDWLHAALALPRVELLALSPAVAVNAMALPESFPGDPADRLIVATTIIERGTLVTRDDRIRKSALVPTAWT
ncbi:MAG TPA: type II toxin-antitoxin system VapC family toxin [Vicinamibacterales bacterium]|nr:type II toxin-antitoxin system VapC family toxin [Vicinamibacterales bacterium]